MIEISCEKCDVKMRITGKESREVVVDAISIVRALYSGIMKIDSAAAEQFKTVCMDERMFSLSLESKGEYFRRYQEGE